MKRFLLVVKTRLTSLVPVTIVMGLVAGYFFDLSILKSMVTLVLFMMIYPMMINLHIEDVLSSFKNPKPILISLALNFLASPLLVLILGKLFFNSEPMLFMGLILIGLLPTSGMTASWTGIARGNLKMTLVLMSLNLMVSMGMIPIYINLFLGQAVSVDMMIIGKSLIQVVIVPLILGDLSRRFLLKNMGVEGFKAFKPVLGGISSLGVIAIVFIAVSLKSKMIIGKLDLVLLSILPLMIYYFVMMIVSHFVGSKTLSREDRIALVYSTSLRNLTVSLGISLSSFGDSLAVFIVAIAYIVQLPFATAYLNYLTKECERSPDCQPITIMG
jgi:ACR3 family arsenite efflux pump ArsB